MWPFWITKSRSIQAVTQLRRRFLYNSSTAVVSAHVLARTWAKIASGPLRRRRFACQAARGSAADFARPTGGPHAWPRRGNGGAPRGGVGEPAGLVGVLPGIGDPREHAEQMGAVGAGGRRGAEGLAQDALGVRPVLLVGQGLREPAREDEDGPHR